MSLPRGTSFHLGGQFIQGSNLLNQAFQSFGPKGSDTDHGALSIHRVEHLGDQRGVLGRQEPIHPRPVPAAGVKVMVGSVTSKAKRALPALTSCDWGRIVVCVTVGCETAKAQAALPAFTLND